MAAVDGDTGQVIAPFHKRHRHQEGLSFPRLIDREMSEGLCIRPLPSNFATHRQASVRAWIAKRNRVHPHFSPTYASWLNQVERRFGLVSRRSIKRSAFREVTDFKQRIMAVRDTRDESASAGHRTVNHSSATRPSPSPCSWDVRSGPVVIISSPRSRDIEPNITPAVSYLFATPSTGASMRMHTLADAIQSVRPVSGQSAWVAIRDEFEAVKPTLRDLAAGNRESPNSAIHDDGGSKMKTGAMALCGVLALLAATGARAETFYDKDGILFEGTIRLAVSNAAVCNVVEDRYSEQEYEELKANQGRPLHLWRIDLSVRNGSGRELDFLRADSWVRSEWPPCTNWDGPEALPEPFIAMRWADNLEVLSMPYGMRAGQEEGRALYMLAFDGQRPRWGEWDINYTFARGASAAARGAEGRGGSTGQPGAAGQLPPDIQSDLYLRKAERAVREGDLTNARLAMERLEALQREHGLEPEGEDHYRHAQAWEAAGEPQRATAAAVRYLQLRGREAEHYDEALDLMNRVESGKPAAAARVPQQPSGTETAPAAPPTPQSRAGESRVFGGMEFAWVPAGEFQMGSTSAAADDDERPLTRVRISRGFWLGRHEVTQSEWQAVMGTNPSRFSGCGSCPVENVSWDDAQLFIGRLNARAGGSRYRLPTEAEWEYAARAGTIGDRYGNLDAIAWHGDNSGRRPQPAGRKAPNAWGLHDMLGNVWEWVQDWHGSYPGGSLADPQGPVSGSYRVYRGGSWHAGIGARGCRSSFRGGNPPGHRGNNVGFRLLRIAP